MSFVDFLLYGAADGGAEDGPVTLTFNGNLNGKTTIDGATVGADGVTLVKISDDSFAVHELQDVIVSMGGNSASVKFDLLSQSDTLFDVYLRMDHDGSMYPYVFVVHFDFEDDGFAMGKGVYVLYYQTGDASNPDQNAMYVSSIVYEKTKIVPNQNPIFLENGNTLFYYNAKGIRDSMQMAFDDGLLDVARISDYMMPHQTAGTIMCRSPLANQLVTFDGEITNEGGLWFLITNGSPVVIGVPELYAAELGVESGVYIATMVVGAPWLIHLWSGD